MPLELSGVVAELPVQGYFAREARGLPGPAVKIRAVTWPQGAPLAEARVSHSSPEIAVPARPGSPSTLDRCRERRQVESLA